uniref:Claudin 4 n=1 Tax=Hucho hucho TaxID=62062 RepID=A0A4W5PUI3_9TELE
MVSQGIQIMEIVMSLIGWLTVIIVCALPMWKVTAFIGANIVTAQTIWEGMWMTCVVQSKGQMQCKVYDSIAMIIISILTGIVGICLSISGGKCTNCTAEEGSQRHHCAPGPPTPLSILVRASVVRDLHFLGNFSHGIAFISQNKN